MCVGLNYDDHLEESGLKKPAYPEIFARFATSLIAHQELIRRPRESIALDYEAELAVVIGKPGRRIPQEQALDHVAGYSLFNDASVRDFQLRTPQWTMGKNFDGTGSFGPWLVTPDAVPPGARGIAHPGPFEWPRDAGGILILGFWIVWAGIRPKLSCPDSCLLARDISIPLLGDCRAVFAPCAESFALEMRKGDLRGFAALSSRTRWALLLEPWMSSL